MNKQFLWTMEHFVELGLLRQTTTLRKCSPFTRSWHEFGHGSPIIQYVIATNVWQMINISTAPAPIATYTNIITSMFELCEALVEINPEIKKLIADPQFNPNWKEAQAAIAEPMPSGNQNSSNISRAKCSSPFLRMK